jgi:3-dehydroquinate synthase
MKINYKIGKTTHQISFCRKEDKKNISKEIERVKSDRNVLLIYDVKINKNITNQVIDDLKLSGCKIFTLKSEGSKKNKNEKFLFKIIDLLISRKFTKKSIIISLGGGVVGDVSALASSLYLRGLIYFNIPSTMTSIVDSCIGGKTAINYKGITNSVGTYYHPKHVFVFEDIFQNIPKREFDAGIAEIIKCGIIDDKKILNFLEINKEKIFKRDYKTLSNLCKKTLVSKIKFFKKDIYEKDKRLFLNFGHTFAHAIEMATEVNLKKDFIRHGEAVGLGMLAEIYYENRNKGNIFNLVKDLLKQYNLPTKLDVSKINISKVKLLNDIYKNLFLDKKKIDKYPRYIAIKNIGSPKIKEIKDFDFINDTILNVLL